MTTKNWKVWLGRPQVGHILCASDFKTELMSELQAWKSQAWMPDKFGMTVHESDRGIFVERASFRQLMELTLRLKTARDVRIKLADMKMKRGSDLKRLLNLAECAWMFPLKTTVSLDVQARNTVFFHEGRIKRELGGYLADLNLEVSEKQKANVRLNVNIQDNRAQLWASLPGKPLYQRGYKASLAALAPMREDLIQGVIQRFMMFLNEDKPQADLSPARAVGMNASLPQSIHVPFAGSGAFGFEYVLASQNLSAHLWRSSYSFDSWLVTPKDTVQHLSRKCADSLMSEQSIQVNFWEKDAEQIAALRDNVDSFTKHAPSGFSCTIHHKDVMDPQLWATFEGCQSTFFINPPYGDRLENQQGVGTLYLQLWGYLEQLVESSGVLICPDRKTYEAGRLRLQSRFQVKGFRFLHGGTPRWALYWKPAL